MELVGDGKGGERGEEIVTNVLVDGEGVHMFGLPNGQLIVVEISLGARGTKMVCVQSVVKICNYCDHVLEVGVFTRQGEQVWNKVICVAGCCTVLQCIAVCCRAVCCSVMEVGVFTTPGRASVEQGGMCCSVLPCVPVLGVAVLQCLQCVAVQCVAV